MYKEYENCNVLKNHKKKEKGPAYLITTVFGRFSFHEHGTGRVYF